jgi:hypothetical protein
VFLFGFVVSLTQHRSAKTPVALRSLQTFMPDAGERLRSRAMASERHQLLIFPEFFRSKLLIALCDVVLADNHFGRFL